MKKILLFAFATIALSGLAQAQIEKGTVLLGGSVNFGGNKSENINRPNNEKFTSANFGITPTIGVAIKPNTILGIQAGYSHGKSKSEATPAEQEYAGYTAGVFLRRYLPLGKGFNLFAQPGVHYNRSTQEHSYPGYENSRKSWSANISLYPGISYAVNKRFHLEAGIGNMANISYEQNKDELKVIPDGKVSESKGSGFSFSSSLSSNSSINIGFCFFLGGKGQG